VLARLNYDAFGKRCSCCLKQLRSQTAQGFTRTGRSSPSTAKVRRQETIDFRRQKAVQIILIDKRRIW
jgi:hypothetical protein